MTSYAEPLPPETAIAQSVLSIAETRSLDALGKALHAGIQQNIGSSSMGLYSLKQKTPKLLFSSQVPEGFLLEYEQRSQDGDPLVERMRGHRQTVDGLTEMGEKRWLRSDRRDLLIRWGFSHCMAAPLLVSGELVGFVYTANVQEEARYSEKLQHLMSILCKAGALALTSMAEHTPAPPKLLNWFDPAVKSTNSPLPLSPRLADVACLIVAGQTNKEIARALHLSDHTVKEYVSSLCRKMNVRNRTELTRDLLRFMPAPVL